MPVFRNSGSVCRWWNWELSPDWADTGSFSGIPGCFVCVCGTEWGRCAGSPAASCLVSLMAEGKTSGCGRWKGDSQTQKRPADHTEKYWVRDVPELPFLNLGPWSLQTTLGWLITFHLSELRTQTSYQKKVRGLKRKGRDTEKGTRTTIMDSGRSEVVREWNTHDSSEEALW